MELYTIGHSAHPIHIFINLLIANNIKFLVDIRSVPASRWHPQYNKAALDKVVSENQIGYIYAGRRLGGRPKDPTCYDPAVLAEKGVKHPRANFSKLMTREWFVQGITDLVKQMKKGKTAILCSEEDPHRCHRHALIAKFLKNEYPDIEVQHIRGNGTVVSAEQLFEASKKQSPAQLRFL